jgi:hypothetical protein
MLLEGGFFGFAQLFGDFVVVGLEKEGEVLVGKRPKQVPDT